MYYLCAEADQCREPTSKGSDTHSSYYGNAKYDNYPVMYVDWNRAKTYCEWAGRRLPTEAEWEKAARGTDGNIYPWGNDAPTNNVLDYNNAVGDTSEVGKYPNGKSIYNALDMAGNVWEWVNDWYQSNYYTTLGNNASNPQGPSRGDERVLRGGSWGTDDNGVRSTLRVKNDPSLHSSAVGFRCAMSATP